MGKFKYPVDTDQFQEIIKQGKFYVDKTEMIYDIINNYKYVFLARPRRFGKSLLCNTFKAFFQGQKDLFEGLKIAEYEKEWEKHPVLHFDMSEMRNCRSSQDMDDVLSAMLEKYETEYGTQKRINDFGARFSQLIRHISKSIQKKVVVIIDEYDTPLMRNLYNEEMKESIRNLLRGFYQTVKLEGEHLRFVFITGVTKFSQLSIFSELNNLTQISMFDKYSGLCGITQEELDTVMRPCVEEYAEKLKITIDEAYALLKKNYDGYRFSPNSKDVYAPFSLLRALDAHDTQHYWFESGTSSSLIEHLRHFPKFNPIDYDGIMLSANAFNVPCEQASTPIPLLYQSGYLSIDTYDKELKTYTLHFPNYEVRQGMVENLVDYLMDTDQLERDTTITNMTIAFRQGDISTALSHMRSWIDSIPYEIIEKKEWMAKKSFENFYKMLMYTVFTLLNSRIDTEVKCILGRADVVIQTPKYVYVLELKVDKTVDDALKQIEDKGYAIQYEASGRKIIKCGVTISSEKRNITHWRAVDETGNIIAEEQFV